MLLQHLVSNLAVCRNSLGLPLQQTTDTVCVSCSIEHGSLPVDWQDFSIDYEHRWRCQRLDAYWSFGGDVCFSSHAFELGRLLCCILSSVLVQLSQAAVHEERTTDGVQGCHAVC